jgi:DNA-directed RNA polymerase specialized sigma24 family protein
MNEFIENHYRINYQKLLKRMTFRAGDHHQAEDIIQESYYRALKYSDSCREGEFDQWFSMILNNTLRDVKREEMGIVHVELDEEAEGQLVCSLVPSQTVREIYELVESKSEVQTEILMLHLKHSYSPTDISKLTPYSYAMIHKIIQRFRKEVLEIYT